VNREPKISEIEKLIKHFRETEREHELLEILEREGIKKDEPTDIVHEFTSEFNEEGIVLNKIAKKEGLRVHHHRPLGKYKDGFMSKWYYRYSLYYVLIFSGIFLFLNAPIIFTRSQSVDSAKSKIISIQEMQSAKMESSAPLDPGEQVPQISTIVIPKIGITAPVVTAQSNSEADIQASLTRGVVHYPGTANPGEFGNVFVTGHSSNFWWIKGSYNYVFANLDKLAVGDQAKIYYNGNKYVYSVAEVKTVLPSEVSVLSQGENPTLTLMTCTPVGTNWKRLIVKFDQVSPKYTKSKLVTKEYVGADRLPSIDSNSTGGVLLAIWEWLKKLFGF
jgi:LPXTG-site transpeptidase (sortase) family protein